MGSKPSIHRRVILNGSLQHKNRVHQSKYRPSRIIRDTSYCYDCNGPIVRRINPTAELTFLDCKKCGPTNTLAVLMLKGSN